ncbi:MAG: type IV conjugative transfer system protein TraL [Limnohabitans sp.]|jgi:type IV conjugative transfer system protein TraL|uniref:type IV conjugative transfer system protein TraL n=1 Tax=Limnohabitans sp. TaxID=1907725 RepID=UPI003918F48C
MKNVKIPRYIDAIPQIFFWEIDEFTILSACAITGAMLGGLNTPLGIAAGIFAAAQFKKYKAGGLPGQLNHIVHWKNLLNINPVYIRGGERRLFK